MPKPRNSDEAPNWDDDDGYIELDLVLKRLDILEDTNLYSNSPEPLDSNDREAN